MKKFSKPILGAVIAGIIGIFFATIGFWRTLMIAILIIMGYLIGTYLETRGEKEK